jgi:hypothetical protein
MDIGDHFVGGTLGTDPAGMNGLEKGQVFRRMDFRDRPETMIIRQVNSHPAALCAAAQLLDALRLFRIG